MASVNPYLNFPGTTEAAFTFYKSVFGGEFVTLQRYKDIAGGDKMSADEQELLMHVALPIGSGTILMGTDTLESMGQALTMGNNFSLSIDTESKEAATELFDKLSAGGQVTMPLQTMFWGAYFGMLTDKFSIQWMVNYDENYPQ